MSGVLEERVERLMEIRDAADRELTAPEECEALGCTRSQRAHALEFWEQKHGERLQIYRRRTAPDANELTPDDRLDYEELQMVLRTGITQRQAAARLGCSTRSLQRLLARVAQVEANQ